MVFVSDLSENPAPPPGAAAALTDGSVGWTLARLAWPMMFGGLAIISFHLADTYFVSRLGTDALAAMSFTFPVVMVIVGLAL